MKRHNQTLVELLGSISEIPTDWKDDFSERIVGKLEGISNDTTPEMRDLFGNDYEVDSTIVRLLMQKSKDEYTTWVKDLPSAKTTPLRQLYLTDREAFLSVLRDAGLPEIIKDTCEKRYTWQDILVERLKAGRGSAIKGQSRGRALEDFVEACVKSIYTKYDVRCSFVGRTGSSKEKADFAIPSKEQPHIVIEVKAYGATGSKQTDVIGDLVRIVDGKRPDTTLILFTDGTTWRERQSDLQKLVDLQNKGDIYRIFTRAMEKEFLADLRLLKREHGLK